MIKYRRLSVDELTAMEREFVLFLVTQGIEARDWQKLKSDDARLADDLIDIFSNHVFEKIVSTTEYLSLCDELKAIFVHAQAQSMTMVSFNLPADQDHDFMAALLDADYELPADAELIVDQMAYTDTGRSIDVYKLMNLGFVKSDGALYKKLCLHYAEIKTLND